MLSLDYKNEITIYEIISLIMSIVALIIPFLQLLCKKVLRKPKIKYYPNGKAKLFFNQSGSYLRIDGVIEAINQPVSIKKIELSVLRKSDSKRMSLAWSSFISPIAQNFVGNISHTTELAHPFRISKDSIACAFTEFCDEFNSSFKSITLNTKELFDSVSAIKATNQNYQDGLQAYKCSSLYTRAQQFVAEKFFWDISKYDLTITISYLNKKEEFKYQIEVNESDNSILAQNIEELLIYPLKNAYGVNKEMSIVDAELREIT